LSPQILHNQQAWSVIYTEEDPQADALYLPFSLSLEDPIDLALQALHPPLLPALEVLVRELVVLVLDADLAGPLAGRAVAQAQGLLRAQRLHGAVVALVPHRGRGREEEGARHDRRQERQAEQQERVLRDLGAVHRRQRLQLRQERVGRGRLRDAPGPVWPGLEYRHRMERAVCLIAGCVLWLLSRRIGSWAKCRQEKKVEVIGFGDDVEAEKIDGKEKVRTELS
jgi:hypothetical protein